MTSSSTATRPAPTSFFNLEALRQCHGLEHGTVWVLSELNPRLTLGGTSTDRGFYIYGPVETLALEAAARQALVRFGQGEESLAVHPRCGTNLSVGMLLTLGLSLGLGSLLPRRPLSQLMGMGLAVYGASVMAQSLGSLAQRHITTAIPRNLEVLSVTPQKDWWGRPAHFVAVRWVS
ncbi:DUF6391 domain-containing protein [Anthocerotibacter panamensis]|uniref:DUF6391 domain-containing protein n=1 Tax=Anthocerotibacter panamensis TaxID=2857077 RepID=UPI001C405973|nr:DUF6391 domain-containing protein [Anthocerotibacter panamensis]